MKHPCIPGWLFESQHFPIAYADCKTEDCVGEKRAGMGYTSGAGSMLPVGSLAEAARGNVERTLHPSTLTSRGDTAARPPWQRNIGSFTGAATQPAIRTN